VHVRLDAGLGVLVVGAVVRGWIADTARLSGRRRCGGHTRHAHAWHLLRARCRQRPAHSEEYGAPAAHHPYLLRCLNSACHPALARPSFDNDSTWSEHVTGFHIQPVTSQAGTGWYRLLPLSTRGRCGRCRGRAAVVLRSCICTSSRQSRQSCSAHASLAHPPRAWAGHVRHRGVLLGDVSAPRLFLLHVAMRVQARCWPGGEVAQGLHAPDARLPGAHSRFRPQAEARQGAAGQRSGGALALHRGGGSGRGPGRPVLRRAARQVRRAGAAPPATVIGYRVSSQAPLFAGACGARWLAAGARRAGGRRGAEPARPGAAGDRSGEPRHPGRRGARLGAGRVPL